MTCPTSRQDCELAPYLDTENYATIWHAMLDPEGHQAKLPVVIADLTENDDAIHGMAGGILWNLIPGSEHPGPNTTFAQQMHRLANLDPDVVLTTYRSAVPVTNAVRGYYDRIARVMPVLEHVDVSYSRRPNDFNFREAHATEASRLASVVDGKRVAVIDQYVGKGRALSDAAYILRSAGAQAIFGLTGHWYADIFNESDCEASYPPADELLEQHAAFMYNIGVRAAETPQIARQSFRMAEATAHYHQVFAS